MVGVGCWLLDVTRVTHPAFAVAFYGNYGFLIREQEFQDALAGGLAVAKGFGALVHRVMILLYHLYRERLFLCSFMSYFRAL